MLGTDELKTILEFIRRELAPVNRITTYARSKTVNRKSVEELQALRLAGLDRMHIGLESGSDAVLTLMKKGVTAAEHIEAGKKVKAAGISLSEYIMPGLGGKALWREHALETARVLNAINPDFIRVRSLRVPARVPLYEQVVEGSFVPLTDDEAAEELRLLVDHLEGITSTVTSDHIMNLLEDVSGTLPQDKGKLLAAIDAYRFLPPEDKLIYRFGRRGGAYRSVKDMKDLVLRNKIEKAVEEVRSTHPEGLESLLQEMVDQTILIFFILIIFYSIDFHLLLTYPADSLMASGIFRFRRELPGVRTNSHSQERRTDEKKLSPAVSEVLVGLPEREE